MTKTDSIPNTAALSAAKFRLLEKYLRGDVSKTVDGAPRIARRPETASVPLAPVQEEVWRRANAVGDAPPFYNESITIHHRGPIDAGILQRCFSEIIHRHEIWRTSYDLIDSQPVQAIHAAPASPFPLVDLRNMEPSERKAEASRLAAED